MHGVVLLLIGVLGSGGVAEYSRSLGARNLDQATLDTEGYGEKKSFKREEDGLRITLSPGDKETGWRTPRQLRFGGDFTISAEFVIKKLPKPAMEDGAAIGLAIAFGDINQPDVTLVRLLETNGSDVYRSIQKEGGNPMPMQAQTRVQMRMQMMQMGGGMQPGGKPPKPPRRTFPAAGDVVRMELQREGTTIRVQVYDKKSARPRYLGQLTLGPVDVSAVKLFTTNRNGAEAVNVLLRDLTIHADRINGLGTLVRTVFDEVIYADPTSMENGVLTLGGRPEAPPVGSNLPDLPEVVFAGPQAGSKPRQNKAPSGAARAQAAAPSRQPAPQEPKARIPLDELESLRFERPPALAARFMGQPNLDFTMPGLSAEKDGAEKGEAKKDGTMQTDAAAKKADGSDDVLAPPPGTTAPTKIAKVEPKKNGIRDLYLSLSGLRAAKIKQITVNCQTDKGRMSWRLDTTGSQDWPLVIRRSGTEISADLFLEPPPGDCHQKDFTIAVNYEDGQAANTTAKAGEHTNSGLAFDPKAPAVAWPDAWLYLTGEEKLFGKLEGIDQETLRLATPWQDHLDVPLTRVLGVHIGLLDCKETPESFSKRLKARGSEDLLLAQTKKGEVIAIPGIVEGTERDKLRFRYQNQTRTLPLQQVEGLVMAARPESRRDDELRPTFSLIGGAVVSGRWKDLDTSVWKIDTAWGQALNLPAAEIQGVRFRGGKMSYLSDLNPGKAEETPFFGHRLSWRRDVSLVGEPLRMNGLAYDRGVAVHSRCILTYDLSGRYSTFEALVGFDDAVKGKGRVDCRVVADGKELYANPDLRADGPPVKLKLPVAGAEQLRLVVDFGRGQDTGDRVIWADARLYRPSPSKTSAPATASRGNSPPESGK